MNFLQDSFWFHNSFSLCFFTSDLISLSRTTCFLALSNHGATRCNVYRENSVYRNALNSQPYKAYFGDSIDNFIPILVTMVNTDPYTSKIKTFEILGFELTTSRLRDWRSIQKSQNLNSLTVTFNIDLECDSYLMS